MLLLTTLLPKVLCRLKNSLKSEQPPISGIKNKEFQWDKYCNMIAIIVCPASGPRSGLKVKHQIKSPLPWTNVTYLTAPPFKSTLLIVSVNTWETDSCSIISNCLYSLIIYKGSTWVMRAGKMGGPFFLPVISFVLDRSSFFILRSSLPRKILIMRDD